MTDLSPIGRRIQDALAAFLRRDPSTITPEQNLREDLGLDSLMTFELLYELEKAFDLEIPNEDLPRLQTLADIFTYVEARVGSSMPWATTDPDAPRSTGKRRQRKAVTPAVKEAPRQSTPMAQMAQATTKIKKRVSGSTGKKRAAPAKSKGKKP